MDLLSSDLLFAASVISSTQMSGIALGFFTSLLTMAVAIELRVRRPVRLAMQPRFIRRGVVIALYIASMYFSSVFVGLTLPSSEVAQFSLVSTILVFVLSWLAFFLVDGFISPSLPAWLFSVLYALVGMVLQFGVHAAFLFVPNNFQLEQVYWGGLALAMGFCFLTLVSLSSFAMPLPAGTHRPVRDRIVFILGVVALNQLVALTLIAFVHFSVSRAPLAPWGLWLAWSKYEVVVSVFSLVLVLSLLIYLYSVLERAIDILKMNNLGLEVKTADAMARVKRIDERLRREQSHSRELEKAIERVERGHKVSIEGLVAALSSLEDGVFEWDIEQDTLELSLQWRRLFGFDKFPNQPVPVNVWRAGVLAEDQLQLNKVLEECLSDPLENRTVQLRYRNLFGALMKIELRMVAVRNPYGLPFKVVGVLHDRTHEMDLELSILEELNEENLLSSRKSQFVDYLSHEIRTPMTIMSSARALIHNCLSQEIVDRELALSYVDQIAYALKSLRALVDETLMFMGSNFSRKRLNIAQVDLAALMKDFLRVEARLTYNNGSAVLLDSPLDQEPFYSDEYALTQAVRQLIGFAQDKDSQVQTVHIARNSHGGLLISMQLKEWPHWMVRCGQLEPCHEVEAPVPFEDQHLPFALLLTKRVIRFIGGRLIIVSQGSTHKLCVDLPSLAEETQPCPL